MLSRIRLDTLRKHNVAREINSPTNGFTRENSLAAARNVISRSAPKTQIVPSRRDIAGLVATLEPARVHSR